MKLITIRYNSDYHNFEGNISEVQTIIPHPLYNQRAITADIALVRTKVPLEYKSYFARLANLGESLDEGTILSLLGWGIQTEDSGSLSPMLRRIDIPLIAYYTCDQTYSMKGINVNSDHLCAGDLYNGGKSFCKGDIGAPLFRYTDDRIFGIASFSIGCGRPGYPPIFTNVASYRKWIDSVVVN